MRDCIRWSLAQTVNEEFQTLHFHWSVKRSDRSHLSLTGTVVSVPSNDFTVATCLDRAPGCSDAERVESRTRKQTCDQKRHAQLQTDTNKIPNKNSW
jgi:hypothetical protein